AGGQPTMKTMVDGVLKTVPNPAYGDLSGLGIALAVLVIILLLTKYGRGLIGNIAVLLGIVIGTFIAMAFGKVS
ncbi:solute carrier family 23 protein, partial [Aeromonas hydrophila]